MAGLDQVRGSYAEREAVDGEASHAGSRVEHYRSLRGYCHGVGRGSDISSGQSGRRGVRYCGSRPGGLDWWTFSTSSIHRCSTQAV